MRKYWLCKSEPDKYSIDDLKNDGETPWDGVRNYAARNSMRDDMQIGDGILYYHSNQKPPAIVGVAEVISAPYPDALQFDPSSNYFDPKSSEAEPRWVNVDVKFVEKFEQPVTRPVLQAEKSLENMELFRLGRLSITPVREEEWNTILKLAKA